MSAYFLLINPFHPRHGRLRESRYEYPEQLSEEFWGDHACAVLSFKHRTDGFFAKVYLAADLDWLPVRYELGKRVEVEFRYGPHADQSPLPTGWIVRTRSPDFKKVESTRIASVKKWESPPEIPDAEFTIEFPVGTVVWDYRPSEHINYVILADGSHRLITLKERLHKISVPVLMKTRPDEAVPRESRSTYRIAVVIVANLIGIVLLLVFLRRMRNKANERST